MLRRRRASSHELGLVQLLQHLWRCQHFVKGEQTVGLGDGSPQQGPGAEPSVGVWEQSPKNLR